MSVVHTARKEHGQYMTPDRIVDLILDGIGFSGERTLSSTIMEPSFGTGNFLLNITRRIRAEGSREGLDSAAVLRILDEHVYGIEKDESLCRQAVSRLNAELAENGLSRLPVEPSCRAATP
jgi:type I restriction-modification system DNA methylase subunit